MKRPVSMTAAIPAWAVAALAVQLVLVFFVPPFALGTRRIYAADLWCMGWVGFALLRLKSDFRGIARITGVAFLLILAVYLHGFFRPSIRILLESEYLYLNESDTFQPGREAFVAARFLSWIFAAILVHRIQARATASAAKADLKILSKVLALCLSLAGIALILDRTFPTVRAILGHIYGFNPAYVHWANRAYGFFASPVEAGAALVFGGLLLVIANRATSALTKPVLAATLSLCAVGLVLTKALTPLLGLIAAIAIILLTRLTRRKLKTLAIISVPAILIAIAASSFTHEGQMKFINLASRTGPWRIYIQEAFSRADTALLGFGFAPYHADDFFVFLFTRGGLVMLATFLAALSAYVRRNAPRWTPAQNLILVYLFVTCLTTDALIFRHVAFLLITLGVPLLALGRNTGNTNP